MTATIRFNAKLLAAVGVAISTDQTRYYLRGVYFHDTKAVATDGHLMTVATDPDAETDGAGHIMPVSDKAITAMKKKGANQVAFANNMLSVIDDNGEIIHIEPCKEIDATFPDYAQIIPNNPGEFATGAFSDKLLSRITTTAKNLGIQDRSGLPISLKGETGTSPHVVTYHQTTYELFSVVMPMRT